MFLVITTPNALDTTVAVTSPRIITEYPEKAFLEARKACTDQNSAFVSQVIVYELTLDRVYTLDDAKNVDGVVIYIAYRSSWDGRWVEGFYEGPLARFK
ncbi:MAG: hypothetical protein UU22_C0045G0007 [Parcubacteria group bacterium GW2011_GWA2_40_8]|uniref:Uncharacterized protein n=1 Tax=Candidatus Terrybacteria bacterium RIFCSPLOWO2_01_FULL_40_23 TaxID=1802366 RepID=A0A1G2PX35_9BACT|nr:MAG: hypothetical protein UT82_C0012G0007 [Parcubacteria group bacterium GW2011_GWB1_40_14]KKR77385.1 MAG: hypothetical protein UU22_C0045G0007 [Parcubacteria group bacterium GW2011_GWA2_40_8]OHA52885.1 MAG: hypothetical protein A3A97_04270 [Candidatus Terrybacteria bacterium RIFCSPLOWO2_01_FULL_40_23]